MAEAKDAYTRRVEALSGGAPLPQADTMRVAQHLLGPDLAARYGDVIGARPTGPQDIARDFAIGVVSGDMFKADSVKARVAQSYREEFRKEEEAARARDEEDRTKLDTLFKTLEQSRKLPKEYRKEYLRHGLAKIGMEADPLTEKILTSPETTPGLELLTDPTFVENAFENPQQALADAAKFLGDPDLAFKLVKQLQGMHAQKTDTQNAILDANRRAEAERRTAGIAQQEQERAELTDIRVAAVNELTARRNKAASPNRPYNPLFKGKSNAEVQAMGIQGSARAPKATGGDSMAAILAEMGGEGAPAEAAPAAPAAPALPAGVSVRKKTESPAVGIPQTPGAVSAPTPLNTTGLLR